jgi:hypothetical protein
LEDRGGTCSQDRAMRKGGFMFKRSIQLLLFACLVADALWAADNPFVGEWKLNPSKSKLTDEMNVESLGGNKYTFDFGGGGETILADGEDHAGHFGTTLSVTVEAPKSWKVVRKKDGRMLIIAIWTLSENSNTLTDDFTFFPENGPATNVKYKYKRDADGAGFAGDWVSTSETMNSAFVLQVRPYEGDGLSFIYPSKETKNVKFDGKDYPNVGPIEGGPTSSIRRVNEHVLEMTDKINGKISKTEQITLSSDLKTLTITARRSSGSEPTIYVFERQ